MLCRWVRTVIAALAATSLLVLAMLPAEHRHLGHEDEGDDHAGVVRRHYAAHPAPATPVVGHHEDDGTVEWLPSTVAVVHSSSLPCPAASVPLVFSLAVTDVSTTVVTRPERSTHDPPWLTGFTLRGPPSFSA